MANFDSLPTDATVAHIYRSRREVFSHWIRMGQEIMRGEGPLSEGQREMIATFVSALNGCEFCYNSHLPTMIALGIEESLIEALVKDIETAPIDDRMKPILEFCRKLTLEPSRIARADADAVYAAGWDEDALFNAIAVTSRFNFMNRLTLGYGLEPMDEEAAKAQSDKRVSKGYDGLFEGVAENSEGKAAE